MMAPTEQTGYKKKHPQGGAAHFYAWIQSLPTDEHHIDLCDLIASETPPTCAQQHFAFAQVLDGFGHFVQTLFRQVRRVGQDHVETPRSHAGLEGERLVVVVEYEVVGVGGEAAVVLQHDSRHPVGAFHRALPQLLVHAGCTQARYPVKHNEQVINYTGLPSVLWTQYQHLFFLHKNMLWLLFCKLFEFMVQWGHLLVKPVHSFVPIHAEDETKISFCLIKFGQKLHTICCFIFSCYHMLRWWHLFLFQFFTVFAEQVELGLSVADSLLSSAMFTKINAVFWNKSMFFL